MVNCSQKDEGQPRFSVSHGQGPSRPGGSRPSHSTSSQPLGWMGSDCSNLGSLVLAPAEHPRGEHLSGGPVRVGHVREGELTGEVRPEAVLRAGAGWGVCHHHRLQHSGTAKLASEDLCLQVGSWTIPSLIPLQTVLGRRLLPLHGDFSGTFMSLAVWSGCGQPGCSCLMCPSSRAPCPLSLWGQI